MNIFHISEIVDLGIEKEKKRRDFYGLAAEQVKDAELKKLFTRLRDWEETHIKKFSEIKSTLDSDEAAESYPGELSAYMQSLVDEKLYAVISAKEFAARFTTGLDIVRHGMSFEKDAILFFNELKEFTSQEHKQVITALIEEEKQHLVYLSQMSKQLQDQG